MLLGELFFPLLAFSFLLSLAKSQLQTCFLHSTCLPINVLDKIMYLLMLLINNIKYTLENIDLKATYFFSL